MFEKYKISNRGFSLIEGIISIAIFSIIFVALTTLFIIILNSVRNNKAENSANSIALEQLEIIRGMDFNEVRTDTGWTLSGDLESEKFLNRAGYNFTVKIDVGWEDDVFDGVSPADTFPYDYKNVRVRVSWINPLTKNENTVAMNTNVVPRGLEGLSPGKGGILVKVFNASGILVPNAEVHIESDEESYYIDATTDLNGNLWAPDLEPSDDYRIVVSKDGYNSDQTYSFDTDPDSPDYNPIPTKPDAVVLAGEITEIGLSIDFLSGLNIQTVNYNNPQNWIVSSDLSDDFQREASVDIDSSDNLFVVWLDGRSGTDRIFAQKYSYDVGTGLYDKQWGGDIQITVGDDKTLPRIETFGLNYFYASWATQASGNLNVYLEKFNSSDGSSVWGPVKVNLESGNSDQQSADLILDSVGNIYVVWMDDRNSGWDIYAQKYNANGNALWVQDLKINTDVTLTDQQNPKIIMDDEDNFYVIWEESINGDLDIYWEKLDSDGDILFASRKVNTDSSALDQFEPSVIFDGSDYFYISWTDKRNSQPDIYAQKYDKLGVVAVAGEWAIADVKINDDSLPDAWRTKSALTFFDENTLYFSWEDDRNGNPDVYSAKFDSTGTKLWDYDLIMNGVSDDVQGTPDVIADSMGYGITVWEDSRSGEPDIYFARYKDLGYYIRSSNPIIVTGAKLKGTYSDGGTPPNFLPIYKYQKEFVSDINGFINIGDGVSELEWDNYSFTTDESHTIISTDQPVPLIVNPGMTENAVINIEP